MTAHEFLDGAEKRGGFSAKQITTVFHLELSMPHHMPDSVTRTSRLFWQSNTLQPLRFM
jgi:hypothetical protein